MIYGLSTMDVYEFAECSVTGDWPTTDELCDDEDCHVTGVCIC